MLMNSQYLTGHSDILFRFWVNLYFLNILDRREKYSGKDPRKLLGAVCFVCICTSIYFCMYILIRRSRFCSSSAPLPGTAAVQGPSTARVNTGFTVCIGAILHISAAGQTAAAFPHPFFSTRKLKCPSVKRFFGHLW